MINPRSLVALGLIVMFLVAFPFASANTFRRFNFIASSSYREVWIVQTSDGGYGLCLVGVISVDNLDFGLAKLSTNGDIEWAQNYGGPKVEIPLALIGTNDGGFVMTGQTTSYGNGKEDFYLMKVDSTGKMLWNHSFGLERQDLGWSVIQTQDNGYVIAGLCTVPDGSWIRGAASIIKTDANGDFQWSQVYSGGTAFDIIQLSDGGYVMVGTTNSGGGRPWIAKTNSQGDLIWNHTLLDSYSLDNAFGPEGFAAHRIIQANDGGFILLGTLPDANAYNDHAVWLAKTDSAGNIIWKKTYPYGYAGDLTSTSDGGYAFTSDKALAKTDSSGNEQWSETELQGYAFSVLEENDKTLTIGGHTYGSDAFIQTGFKLSPVSKTPEASYTPANTSSDFTSSSPATPSPSIPEFPTSLATILMMLVAITATAAISQRKMKRKSK